MPDSFMHSLPDRSDPVLGGRFVDDARISKHTLPNLSTHHFFRRNLRTIVHKAFAGVLPEVHPEDDTKDNSTVWRFTLSDGSGADVLRGARPLGPAENVPAPAIDALEKCMHDLEIQCQRGTADAQKLGEAFELPNPELAAGLYRLHGPPWSRRLTALWGSMSRQQET